MDIVYINPEDHLFTLRIEEEISEFVYSGIVISE